MHKAGKIVRIAVLFVLLAVLAFTVSLRKGGTEEKVIITETAEPIQPDITEESVPEVSTAPEVIEYHDVSILGRTVSTSAETIDLSSITYSDIDEVASVLPEMAELQYVNLGDETSGISLEDLNTLYEAAPDVKFAFGFTRFGKQLNTYDETLDLNHISMDDDGAEVRAILPYMRNLKTLDMDSCGVSNEAMDSIRKDYPNVDVIWRIWFGSNYTARTNVTKILASKPSWGGEISNESAQQLKYCTKLKFLDLGHNDSLSDFSFISELEDLRVAVISMTECSDLTPFSDCKKLWYIEAGNCKLNDLSPLAECTSLEHLNVGTNYDVKDISSLYGLNLKRLWLGVCDPVPNEQIAKMKELHPEIEIDTTVPSGLEVDENGKAQNEGFVMGKWKSYKQYLAADWAYVEQTGSFPAQHPKGYYRIIYDGFEYELVNGAYAFESNDPLLYEHASIYEPTSLPETEQFADVPQIRYLTFDTENEEMWKTLAETYETETGIKVEIETADPDSYSDILKKSVNDVDCPTIFELSGAVDLDEYGSYCEDLSGSAAASELISNAFSIHSDGAVAGIARNMDTYGIIVNISLLEKAGYSIDEIKGFADIKRISEDITARRENGLGFSAFVVPDMADKTDTGFTTMLVNVPIALEWQNKGIEHSSKLDGTYMNGLKDFWNLVMNNCCCSHYDLSPVGYVQKSLQQGLDEFCDRDGVFFMARSSVYEYIREYSTLKDEDITMIPVYLGHEGEETQGLCTGTTSYWCVNSAASKSSQNASIDFLNWCVTSETATKALAEAGTVLPYKDAQTSDNLFIKLAVSDIEEGKNPVSWCFASIPTDAWRDEVNYEMGAWAANLGDWNDIYSEIVNVWGAEYSVK